MAQFIRSEVPAPRGLAVSLCLLVPLLYLTLGQAAGLPLPAAAYQGHGPLVLAAVQLALTLPICWLCRGVFTGALRQLRQPGRCLPAGLGAAAALACGLVGLAMLCAGAPGSDACNVGFGAAGAIPALSCAGWYAQDRLLYRADQALARRLEALPGQATAARDGKAVHIAASDLTPGEIFLVKPGSAFPADGVVLEGRSCVSEAAVTGSDTPVNKAPGDRVFAGSVNQDAPLACRAEQTGDSTALAQAVRLCRQAAGGEGPAAQTALRTCRILSLTALAVAAAAFVVWMLLGSGLPAALARAVCVLAVCCPGALCLAAPAAVLAGCDAALRQGVLFKTADALEGAARARTILLDKDGAVTTGTPGVVEVVGTRNVPAKFLLGLAAGLEAGSEDTLASAVLRKAQADGVKYRPAADLQVLPGQGRLGKVAGKVMAGGNEDFIRTQCQLTHDLVQAGQRLAAAGATLLYFALDRHAAGVIGVADVVRPSSREAVATLQAQGLRVMLLAGGDADSAARIAALVGLDAGDLIAGVQPEDKPALVRRIAQPEGAVLVGSAADAALAQADAGVAMGIAKTPAEDAGSIVLLRGDLAGLPAALELARRTVGSIRRSVQQAGIYHLAALVLAAACPLPGPVLALLASGAFGWYALRAAGQSARGDAAPVQGKGD